MAKEEWGTKRKCQECSSTFYDFKKENPVCPKCGTTFEKKELIAEIEKEEEDIPEDNDEVIIDKLEKIDDEEYNELDVENDMRNVDSSKVNDDDIDNVFIDETVNIEDDIEDSLGTMEDEEY